MYPKSLRWLYLVNLALMATHQADAAYWREWNILGLVGGHGAFLIMIFIAFAFFIHGFGEVVEKERAGLWYAGVLAGGGLTTAACHAFFLARVDSAFTTPVSLLVLAAIAIASAAQIWVIGHALPGSPEDAELPEPEFVD